ncbi:hypothetical protein C2G38_2165273 [Gigaspora rosea]|uniref:Uncharacterized protein n=1 Tax=Gigaspora rosea TaxID=44941 RepID=A0A397VXG5_9GLOM|nr:hypothetical protein C2G38_2165273 [Gigaspora rosea]
MSFFKKFVNNLNKRNTFTKKEVVEEDFWGWNIQSFCSTSLKEESNILTQRLDKEENQIIQEIETSEYKIFISYEKFKEHLLNENLINIGTTYRSKEKCLKNILEFLEAHIRSYFNLFNDCYSYYIQYNTLDLMEHRRKSYKNNFEIWFQNMNLYCEKIKYIWSYIDLEKYYNAYLSY